jgi:DUF3096 family protein
VEGGWADPALEPATEWQQENTMTIGVAHLSPLLSIIFGVLILLIPRLLNYLVAVYLILAGLLGLGVVR